MRIVFFLIVFSFLTSLPAQKGEGVIEVMGTASMEVEPDFLDIQIVIEHQAEKAADVQKALMEKSSKILNYLERQDGIVKVKTDHISLMPRQNYQSKEITYDARQLISFRFIDLGVYEQTIPGLLELGVTGIMRSVFGTSKLKVIEDRLVQQALQDAREKASLIANSLGQDIGKAIYISDQMGGSYPNPATRGVKLSLEAPSIEGGAREISQSVIVHFQLN